MEQLAVMGKWIMVTGVVLFIAGVILWLLSRIPGLNQLPGTIRLQGQNFTCIIPILGMILLSILLTIILNVVIRLMNK
jgi:hypothetical protein